MLINLKRSSPSPCNMSGAAEVVSWQVAVRLIGFPSTAQRCIWEKQDAWHLN